MKNWLCILTLFGFLCLAVPTSANEDWHYSVRPGDTLWHLCEKFTLKPDCWLAIGPYNQVDYPKKLSPGTLIRFPAKWLKLQPEHVEIISSRGQFWITHPESEDRVQGKTDDTLSIGSILETDANARVGLRFADGSRFYLGPMSTIKFDEITSHGKGGMVDAKIYLEQGRVRAIIQKHDRPRRFQIRTPNAVTAVRGTEFLLESDAARETTKTSVLEGLVNIANAFGETDSGEGFGVITQGQQAPSQPKKLLNPADLSVWPASVPWRSPLKWQAIKGAESYRVVLYDQSNSATLEAIASSKPKFKLPDTIAGCVRIQINAIDQEGLMGLTAQRKLCIDYPDITWQKINFTDDTLTLTWNKIPRATVYRIEVAPNHEFKSIVKTIEVEATHIQLQGEFSDQFIRVTALYNQSPVSESPIVPIESFDERPFMFTIFSAFLLFFVL